MEPYRGTQYRAALLPWEQQFCESVGITTEEYFEFHDLVTQYIKKEQGRELIPDIRNETGTVALVLTVVGLALQGVSMLLAPKPQAPEQKEQGGSFRGADRRARTKYAPLSEFDSVQELANLGDIVPLIFCNRLESQKIGGVRVDSQMLWSKMVNRRTYQEMHALMLFSAGNIAQRPDFDGFAFGRNKMSSYIRAKIGLWFAHGSSNDYEPLRVGNQQQYDEGTKDVGRPNTAPFESYWPYDNKTKMVFCGTSTPTQAAQFGQYAPIRNGQPFKYAFKYPGKGDGDAARKELVRNTRQKHLTGYQPGRTSLVRSGNSHRELTFTINWRESNIVYMATSESNSGPWHETADHFDGAGGNLEWQFSKSVDDESWMEEAGGITEGINAINESKIHADTALEVGELYLIGEAVYRCTNRSNRNNDVEEGTPFEPEKTGTIRYQLTIDDGLTLSTNNADSFVYVDGPNVMRNEAQCPIQKLAIGAISTTRAVDMVEIGIKSSVYRQINGYPNINNFTNDELPDEYAKTGGGFELGTMNAYYDRVSLFRLEIKKGDGEWIQWNRDNMFAVHGNNPLTLYNSIRIQLPEKDFYEFRFVPFCGNSYMNRGERTERYNGGWKEYINRSNVYLLNTNKDWMEIGNSRGYKVSIRGSFDELHQAFTMSHPYWATGESRIGPDKKGVQTNPGSLLNDYWFFAADTPSHENNPEHEITWLNEYVDNSKDWYDNEKDQYNELAYAGVICQSSTEISSFSNFSAYFNEGIKVQRLYQNGYPYGASNSFPDIAYALLINRRFGVGEMIGNNSVDIEKMELSSKFCRANGFYWDGVIAERVNVRQFLFEQAAYQLLDFTIIGGRFSLFPTVPYDRNYKILNKASAGSNEFPIKALFTNGNVRNFKTTFLSPQERQLFTAEVKYRYEAERNGFPDQRSVRVRLNEEEGGYFRDPVEIFDLSQFCTSRKHAVTFAKYALRVRQLVDHAVSFETTPDAAHNLAPGDYIRVNISIQHQERERGYTRRLVTGSISEAGIIQGSGSFESNEEVYYWAPGTTEVKVGRLQTSADGLVSESMRGVLFTVKKNNSESRIYKVESIAFSEDSFVEIAATYIPIEKSDETMSTLKWDDKDFVIEDQADG